MHILNEIDNLLIEVKKLRPLNQGELKRLQEEFLIDNTYNSNAIEGNTLTLRETAIILQEGIIIAEKSLKEHLEVIGHKDAFEFVLTLVNEDINLSEKIIKDIHTLVLMNDRENKGIYRRLPVSIKGTEHTPPQPYLVPIQMEKLLKDYTKLKKDKHIIEAASLFHLEFESIHPFIDGNGRTGRLILNFELMKAGLFPVNIKFKDRNKYYRCFDEYLKNKSCTDMTNLIAQYELEEITKYLNIVKNYNY